MTDKRNVMYIFNDTGFGGAGQSLLDTLSGIKNDVNPVIIIRDDAAVEDKFCEIGIKCYKIYFFTDYVKIGSADDYKRVCDIVQSYEAALSLIPIIEAEKIQLIHINSSTSYFAAIAAIMADIPFIWHIRELMEEQFGCVFLNEELKVSLYKKADKLIAISDYVRNRYYEKYKLDMIRVYNGLDIGRFKKHEQLPEKFNKTFIAAGMITQEKGQWNIIQAVELLRERGYSDIKVIIVGSGAAGYIWALKKYIKRKNLENSIYILPFQDDLSCLRNQASYAITSSQNEALGRVTIESMLAGNLVIGARSGGTIEIIGSNEERGFLYELNNSKSLADTMERVMDCEDEIKKIIIKKARQYAEDVFDSKKYCQKLVKMYDEVLEEFESYKCSDFLCILKEYFDSVKNKEQFKENPVPYKSPAIMLNVVLDWLELKQRGHSLDAYFKQNGIRNIAIYGMGALGCRLYDELENTDIEIKCLMDQNPCGMDRIFKFAALDKEMVDADMIVVTVISSERQVVEAVKSRGYERVVGMSEVLNSFHKDAGRWLDNRENNCYG